MIERIKQNLIRRDYYVSISLPQTDYDDELAVSGTSEHDRVLLFSVDGEDYEVHGYAEIFYEQFVLAAEDDDGADVQESGELELF